MTDIDALVGRLDSVGNGRMADNQNIVKACLEAAGALRELEKDAKRYRWLRDGNWGRATQPKVWDYLMHPAEALKQGGLDAAIDAAQLAPSGDVQP